MSGVVIVGAGPGIGQSVARRFAREGMPIALVTRKEETLQGFQPDGPRIVKVIADSTNGDQLRAALDRTAGELGPPEVLVYNAALIRPDKLGGVRQPFARQGRCEIPGDDA